MVKLLNKTHNGEGRPLWVARPAENSWRLPVLDPLGTGEQPRRLFQIAFPGSYRRMIFRVFTSLRLRHKLLRICEPSSAKYASVQGFRCKPIAPASIVRCGCNVAQTIRERLPEEPL